jgi:hypothetical protein
VPLEKLEDFLTDIDMARDLHSLGGWPRLVRLLDPPHHTRVSLMCACVHACVRVCVCVSRPLTCPYAHTRASPCLRTPTCARQDTNTCALRNTTTHTGRSRPLRTTPSSSCGRWRWVDSGVGGGASALARLVGALAEGEAGVRRGLGQHHPGRDAAPDELLRKAVYAGDLGGTGQCEGPGRLAPGGGPGCPWRTLGCALCLHHAEGQGTWAWECVRGRRWVCKTVDGWIISPPRGWGSHYGRVHVFTRQDAGLVK